MGLFDGWKKKQRVRAAAEQMWNLLKRGYNFEIPLLFDKNDLTVESIAELQRRHPQAQLRMYQSRGMVLGLFRGENGQRGTQSLAEGTIAQLQAAGHIGEGYKEVRAEDLLQDHEAFLVKQHLDPKEEEAHAQAERAERDALVIGGIGGKSVLLAGEDALDVPPGALQHDTEAVALKPDGQLDMPTLNPDREHDFTETSHDGAAK